MIFQLLPLLVVIQVALGQIFGSSISNGQFTKNLFANVTKVDKLNNNNLIFSPASIHTCLALINFGARGKTAFEIALHLRQSTKDTIAHYENLNRRQENLNRRPSNLKIANKIYTNNLEIKPEFNAVATQSFESEVENLNFTNVEKTVNTINNWVAAHTNDKIQNLVNSEIISRDTQMILVNAIHFEGRWKIPLTVGNGIFMNNGTTLKRTLVMNTGGEYLKAYLDFLEARAIKIPYNNSDLSMMIILPNEETGLYKLENKLKNVNLLRLRNLFKLEEIEISIPKFKIESEINMKEILKDMGIRTMFSNDAEFDFFNMPNPEVKVQNVVHKVFIDVNEKGTEAAGVTAFEIRVLGGEAVFYADHPFFFAILDDFNVYFTGHLLNV